MQNQQGHDWQALNKNLRDQAAGLSANARDAYSNQMLSNRLTNEELATLRHDQVQEYLAMLDSQYGRERELTDLGYQRVKDLNAVDEVERVEVQRQYDQALEDGDIDKVLELANNYKHILSGENATRQAMQILRDKADAELTRVNALKQQYIDAGLYTKANELNAEADYWKNTVNKINGLDLSDFRDGTLYKLEAYKKMSTDEFMADPDATVLADATIGTVMELFADPLTQQYQDGLAVLKQFGIKTPTPDGILRAKLTSEQYEALGTELYKIYNGTKPQEVEIEDTTTKLHNPLEGLTPLRFDTAGGNAKSKRRDWQSQIVARGNEINTWIRALIS